MINDINSKSVSILMRGQIPVQDPSAVRQAAPEQKTDYSKYRTQKDDSESLTPGGGSNGDPNAQQRQKQKLEPIRVEKKVGRNDPCPCGSGKKYKNCHGN